MIELCFHPSLQHALTRARRRQAGVTVMGIHVDLSWGDLTAPFPPEAVQALDRLQAEAAQGETIRIWTDTSPAGACGLRFAVHLLQEAPGPLWAVPLTKEYRRPDGVRVVAAHWGEVSPQALDTFADPPVLLDQPARQALAQQWNRLRQENAPLRIVAGDTLRSAAADHYDASILAACPEAPCQGAALIGQLVSWQLGIDDQFWAARVEALVAAGKLKRIETQGGGLSEAIIARG